jgi:hypothetical protein
MAWFFAGEHGPWNGLLQVSMVHGMVRFQSDFYYVQQNNFHQKNCSYMHFGSYERALSSTETSPSAAE